MQRKIHETVTLVSDTGVILTLASNVPPPD
jgi:hypothetical protein